MVLNHPMLFPVPYIHSNADNLIHFLVILRPPSERGGENHSITGRTHFSCLRCLSEWEMENIAAQVTLLWSVKPTTFDWILPNDKNNLTLATRGEREILERAREFSSMNPSQALRSH